MSCLINKEVLFFVFVFYAIKHYILFLCWLKFFIIIISFLRIRYIYIYIRVFLLLLFFIRKNIMDAFFYIILCNFLLLCWFHLWNLNKFKHFSFLYGLKLFMFVERERERENLKICCESVCFYFLWGEHDVNNVFSCCCFY